MNLKTVLYLFFIEDKLQKTVISAIFFKDKPQKTLVARIITVVRSVNLV